MLRKQPQDQEVGELRHHDTTSRCGAWDSRKASCRRGDGSDAGGDVVMVDAKAGGENAGREEEARNRPEEARESGIARAVIASETRPKPVEEWLEREIGGKVFKLGRSLEGQMQD